MSRKKRTGLERLEAVREYLQGGGTQKEFAQKLGIGESTFRDWVLKYRAEGAEGVIGTKNREYSSEIKQAAVLSYLRKDGSLEKICRKYGIKDRKTLRSWLKAYDNGLEETTSSEHKRSRPVMNRGRNTTLEERVEIVGYCLTQCKDYHAAAQKYGISYQQVYNWVRKYEALGAEGLEDRRGKRKGLDDMDESARLRAENKLLLARIQRAELENIVLKKLEEIERRGC